jgi:hypothetical protein
VTLTRRIATTQRTGSQDVSDPTNRPWGEIAGQDPGSLTSWLLSGITIAGGTNRRPMNTENRCVAASKINTVHK